MAERDLKLHSLGRYGKSNSRLILEEHSHCEVPAGCGGVVLRWRNPNSGLLFVLHFFGTGKGTILLDGKALTSARPLISFGEHVFSLALTDIVPGSAILGFAGIHDESQFSFPRVSQPSGRKMSLLSAADGSWKYVTTEPADDTWSRPGFDDSLWRPMTACEPPSLDKQDMQKYRLETILKMGGACLGIEGQSSRVWIRKSFTINQDPLKH
jgi:hypothetical protein